MRECVKKGEEIPYRYHPVPAFYILGCHVLRNLQQTLLKIHDYRKLTGKVTVMKLI
jgi:hypothetical protein